MSIDFVLDKRPDFIFPSRIKIWMICKQTKMQEQCITRWTEKLLGAVHTQPLDFSTQLVQG